ncbi:3-deoxy-manno-octulosonate cytidylyltransferase [Candidatus Poribacteria bacterium]|nr:3-deoxy-manno-octulosonate cytidylyltransferase [Candidatus Poribacteria bacterium]
MSHRIVCVIPARYGAQRLPGKPLAKLLGKPMVQWVAEAAGRVSGVHEVLVATDDDRIRAAVEAFGGTVVMTPAECPSGTDRIQHALRGREADIVINVQGDEPGMNAATIRSALDGLLNDAGAHVGTACIPMTSRTEFEQPHNVKVVRGGGARALYFSRSPIPSPARAEPELTSVPDYVWGYKHLGLYVYRRDALEQFVKLPQSRLEKIEKLEQLRFLEAGYSIVCPGTEFDSIGVDIEADIPRAEELLRKTMAAR